MLVKIKEKILKKRFAVPLLAFLSLLIFYPAKAAAAWFLPFVVAPVIMGISAAVAGFLAKGLTALSLIGGILVFGWALSRAFMGLGLSFLNWGISGTIFTNGMSMTNPANNVIIQIGWTLLRDLTNMFFILGLAYIGLATALNFASFNTKKTFTTLILVALLINFTPVICGLIVDASNIVMNFFLAEVDFNQISDSYAGATKTMGEIQESSLKENLAGRIGEYFLMSVYGITAGSVLMIFGCILLMRHFIIWILVILSPLAFFLRIFDFSKQWYTKWWGWFVSWSFIGIPAAFFLYLANHLLIQTKTGQVSGANIVTEGLGAALTPYLITVVFMIIALITTLKIKAAGSGIIMNTANKLVTKAKSVPGLIDTKVATPMAKQYGKLASAGVMGAMLGRVARRKAEDDALAQGRVFTKGAARRKVEKDALAQGKTLSNSDKKKEVASLLAQNKANIQVAAIQKAVVQAQAQGKILTVEEKKRIATDALKQNERELRKLSEEKINAGVEGGLKVVEEKKRKTAALKERMGFKPRELTDLDPNELQELANNPATTEEGMKRRREATKKLMSDNIMTLEKLREIANTPTTGKADGSIRAQAIKKLVDDDNFEYTPAVAGPMLAMMQKEYPGMNLQKLRKSRPDLIHLIDQEGFDKERERLGWAPGTAPDPIIDAQARNNLIKKQSSKMGAEDFSKTPIEDIANDIEGDEMIVNMFLGMDAGKITEYGKKASTRRKEILKDIATPPAPGAVNTRWDLLQSIFAASTATEKNRIQKLINSVYDPNFL